MVDAKQHFVKAKMEEDTPPEEMDKQTEPVSDNIAAALENFSGIFTQARR